MIRAVVFDLWNTLVRSQAGGPFRRIRTLLDPAQAAQLDGFMWDSMRKPYPDCGAFLGAWRGTLGLAPAQEDAIRRIFAEAAQDADLFPGALAALDRTGVLARTAMLSNTQCFDMELLEGLGLARRLRTRVLSAEIGALKPEPAAFTAVEKRLGLFPGDLAMVGDSWEDDIRGALEAGWTAIWVNRDRQPRRELDPEAEFVEVPDLDAVPEVIRRLQEGARCSTCLG